MIYPPGKTGVARLRPPKPDETDAIQAVWEASYAADDPASRARGGWSAAAWATDSRVLELRRRIVGVVAVRAEPAPDGAMPARVALAVAARTPVHSALLLNGALDLIRSAGGELARLFIPSRSEWIRNAAREAGFGPVRTIAHMMLPASAPTPPEKDVEGLSIRPIREGEDRQVLDVLNRNWAGTWNFVEIPLEMLQEDLDGQREGMLLGVDEANHIIATCHAVFDPNEVSSNGYPRAWISNLTVHPQHRQRGIARTMLAAGIAHLRARGAGPVTLGVDASDPAPFQLYQSVGFQVVTSQEAWDKPL